MAKKAGTAAELSDTPSETPRSRVDALNAQAWALRYGNPEEMRQTAEAALVFAEKAQYTAGKAEALRNLGVAHCQLDQYAVGLELLQQSLSGYQELQSTADVLRLTSNIATAYQSSNQYTIALDWHFKVLKMLEDSPQTEVLANTLNNIGHIYYQLEQFESALEYLQRAVELLQNIGNPLALALALNNIGNSYEGLGRLDDARTYQEEALNLAQRISNVQAEALALQGLGRIATTQKSFTHARKHLEQALACFASLGKKHDIGYTLSDLTALHIATHEYNEALMRAMEMLDVAKEINNKDLEFRAYELLSIIYEATGNIAAALEYYRQYAKLKMRTNQIYANQSLQSLQTYFNFLNAEKEKEIYRLKNIALSDALNQIQSSIAYARRIQEAMLPDVTHVRRLVKDCFILSRPRDQVSGDFYWADTKHDDVIIIAADCTGHGVPGALISMLGHTLLNAIIKEKGITDPDAILALLDVYLTETLRSQAYPTPSQPNAERSTTELNDGMDASVIRYNRFSGRLDFAGAMNSAYLYRKAASSPNATQLIELRADRHTIGGLPLGTAQKAFTAKSISIEAGDVIYLCSDGFRDQLGYDEGRLRKYTSARFQALLRQVAPQPLAAQHHALDDAFDTWRADFRQLDDVLVMGIQFE